MFDERVRALLDRRSLLGVVTTWRGDGFPQSNPVWFRLDGDEIRIWTDEQRRWIVNLQRHPQVAFSVHENESPWASVSVRGWATLDSRVGDRTIEEIRRISSRYLDPDEIDAYVDQWPQTRSIVTIEPTAVFFAQAFEDPVAHRRT
jgi:PPOX class probable F420-dependent enzyme